MVACSQLTRPLPDAARQAIDRDVTPSAAAVS